MTCDLPTSSLPLIVFQKLSAPQRDQEAHLTPILIEVLLQVHNSGASPIGLQ